MSAYVFVHVYVCVCVQNVCICAYYDAYIRGYTVRPLLVLFAVLGRTKFWSQKPRIIEVRIIEI